ncbi:MAG: amidohydrolase family protein [Clostridiales bacterium]|nr:amidohydrolase family protein [Clostridiales bacterium]
MYDFIIKGRLIDGVSAEAVERGILAVKGDRIAYAGTETGFQMPENAELIGADTILPGFFDVHAHLSGDEDAGDFAGGRFFGDQLMGAAYQAGLLLDAGFTGIRDMSEAGVYLSRAQERGILRAPRILPGGRILGITSGHVDMDPYNGKEDSNRNSRMYRLCDGADDCLLAVREQFRIGAKFIKICATGGVSSPTDRIDDLQFSPQKLRTIVEETRRHHSYVAAHCTGNEGAYQALLAGVECIEHGVVLTRREIDLMAEKNATLVTTLAVSLGVKDFPGIPDWMKKKVETTAKSNIHTIGMARKAGIRIALGTDYSNSKNTPFKHIGGEFHAMVRAGMTPMEAIRAGTINGAYLMNCDGDTGSLEKGKLADIVLVNGNPLKSIECLGDAENIAAVYLGGTKVK